MPRRLHLGGCAVLMAMGLQGLEFYVSPAGSDGWSGRRPAANATMTDGPFASLQRARQAVRRLKAEGELAEPVDILIREGEYALTQPFLLGPEDSGTASCPVIYRAYRNESPVLIGAREIGGWEQHGALWTTDLGAAKIPPHMVRQVFFKGRRQTEARYPNADPDRPVIGGWAYVSDEAPPREVLETAGAKRTFRLRESDRRRWARPERGRVFIFPGHEWWNNIVPIESFDPDTGVIS